MVSVEEEKCIRIVDFYGEVQVFSAFIEHLEKVMKSSKAEYIDLYCAGLNADLVEQAGFSKVNQNVVIPNYFEPLVRKNCTISCS